MKWDVRTSRLCAEATSFLSNEVLIETLNRLGIGRDQVGRRVHVYARQWGVEQILGIYLHVEYEVVKAMKN